MNAAISAPEKAAQACRELIADGDADRFVASFCATCAEAYPKHIGLATFIAINKLMLAAVVALLDEERTALRQRLAVIPDLAARLRAGLVRSAGNSA